MIDDGILWELDKVIKTPYSDIIYYDPTFSKWEEWFAWRPVKQVYYYHHSDGFGKGIPVYKWVWLKTILRRKVIDDIGGPGREGARFKRSSYEYTTLIDMLKNNGY